MPDPSGVMVEFRDNITSDLVWSALMLFAPTKDDTCAWTDADGVTGSYEVNRVAWAFAQPLVGAGAEEPTIRCGHVVMVYVTEQ